MSDFGAAPGRASVVHHEPVMGTVVTFDVRTPAPAGGVPVPGPGRTAPVPSVEAAVQAAVGWLHWVDTTFSTYKPGAKSTASTGANWRSTAAAPNSPHLRLCHELQRNNRGLFRCLG